MDTMPAVLKPPVYQCGLEASVVYSAATFSSDLRITK